MVHGGYPLHTVSKNYNSSFKNLLDRFTAKLWIKLLIIIKFISY